MVRKLLAILSFQCLLCTAFAANYLTFTAEEDGSRFGISNNYNDPDIQYSLDEGATWTQLLDEEMITLEHKGDKALLKGENPNGIAQNDVYYTKFKMTGSIAASGSVMSLIDGIGESVVIPSQCCFYRLFINCSSLTQAPELPATTLTFKCYFDMFWGCSNLTKAPALPATILAQSCYLEMFRNCTSLTQAPELPATALTFTCYGDMFNNCTSLTKAPALPATTLDYGCYGEMFSHCTSLTQAPELPATTLAESCYAGMFEHCTSLTQAPELPSSNMTSACYNSMFEGCTSLTKAPVLYGTKIYDYFAHHMFKDCTNLSEISVSFSKWSEIGALHLEYEGTEDWVVNVAPTGTFICPKELPIEYGPSRIPEGWNVEYICNDDAVEDIANENTRVWTDGLNLYVRYAGIVEVYDLNGKQICKEQGDADSPMCLSMPAHGVYVVKMGGKSSKVEL